MLKYFEIKKAFRYFIKQIDCMLPCVCSVIDHSRRQNVVRTSVTHSATPHLPLFCSYHILTSSVIYYWTDARQHEIYLLNWKPVPCFYRVLDTRMVVRENKKCWGSWAYRLLFPQLFWVLPNFHECFYNSIETGRTCFLLLLENIATKKKKDCMIACVIITSTARATSVFILNYRNKYI